jgi:transposase
LPRTNPTYPPEFRREAIRLVRASDEEHPIPGIAREIGVSDGTLRNNWVNQDEVDSGERAGLTTEEKEELRKLRREVKTLRQEKEILRKAAAFFATSPERRSGVGERFQAHRRGEGQLLGDSAMQDDAGCSEFPRRAATTPDAPGVVALQEEPRGCRPHGEDPRGSPQEPRDLRLPAGARRAAFARDRLRSAQGGSANAGRGASGLHARQEASNHLPRPKGCSRTGLASQGLHCRSAQQGLAGGHHVVRTDAGRLSLPLAFTT